MLPQKNRLLASSHIGLIVEKGLVYKTPLLLFRFLAQGAPPTRVAFSLSKKKLKKATLRNRLRRKVMEAVRLNLPALRRPCWILVLTRSLKEIQKASFKDLKKSVLQFFDYLSHQAP